MFDFMCNTQKIFACAVGTRVATGRGIDHFHISANVRMIGALPPPHYVLFFALQRDDLTSAFTFTLCYVIR